jgi:hypothetical protein
MAVQKRLTREQLRAKRRIRAKDQAWREAREVWRPTVNPVTGREKGRA